jgi:hypothetical protein
MGSFKSFIGFVCAAFFVLGLAASLQSQQVHKGYMNYSEKELIKIWNEWKKKLPVSEEAIELEMVKSFPTEEDESNGVYFWAPMGIESLPNGNIIVNDQKVKQIFMFDAQGDFVKKIGRAGQGPGEFGNPLCMSTNSNTIVVADVGNMRIQYYDFEGNFIRELKIFKSYWDVAVSADGLIYAAPHLINPESNLVDVLDNEGKLLTSFGETIFGDRSTWQLSNWIKISLNEKNELYVSFNSFPHVCRYSANGDLLVEFKLEHKVLKEMEKENRDRLKKHDNLMRVLYSIRANQKGFSILFGWPRTQILEYDYDGKLVNEYYYEYETIDKYYKDYVLIEKDKRTYFYLLEIAPEKKIVILRPKKISSD